MKDTFDRCQAAYDVLNELYYSIENAGLKNSDNHTVVEGALEQAYLEGRSKGIDECAQLAEGFDPDPESGRAIAKEILALKEDKAQEG